MKRAAERRGIFPLQAPAAKDYAGASPGNFSVSELAGSTLQKIFRVDNTLARVHIHAKGKDSRPACQAAGSLGCRDDWKNEVWLVRLFSYVVFVLCVRFLRPDSWNSKQ
jgi:hypothetical protein